MLLFVGLALNTFQVHLIDKDNKVLTSQVIELQTDAYIKTLQLKKVKEDNEILTMGIQSFMIENNRLSGRILFYQEEILKKHNY